jgi:hypothetical protein
MCSKDVCTIPFKKLLLQSQKRITRRVPFYLYKISLAAGLTVCAYITVGLCFDFCVSLFFLYIRPWDFFRRGVGADVSNKSDKVALSTDSQLE